jgi:hypothetical protein
MKVPRKSEADPTIVFCRIDHRKDPDATRRKAIQYEAESGTVPKGRLTFRALQISGTRGFLTM